MNADPKFDYGDQVKVRAGEHKDRLGDVVGMSMAVSLRTYTVEFGDGTDSEIEEDFLSTIDE
jgi:hypothetical protein